jgi:hypothetical protein
MSYLVTFGRFWYDFIVGDDWRIAASVVAVIALSAALVAVGVNAWWLMLVGIAGSLAVSVYRAAT